MSAGGAGEAAALLWSPVKREWGDRSGPAHCQRCSPLCALALGGTAASGATHSLGGRGAYKRGFGGVHVVGCASVRVRHERGEEVDERGASSSTTKADELFAGSSLREESEIVISLRKSCEIRVNPSARRAPAGARSQSSPTLQASSQSAPCASARPLLIVDQRRVILRVSDLHQPEKWWRSTETIALIMVRRHLCLCRLPSARLSVSVTCC